MQRHTWLQRKISGKHRIRENIKYWGSIIVKPFLQQAGHINYVVKQIKIHLGYQQEEISGTGALAWPSRMGMKEAGEVSSCWGSHRDKSNGKRGDQPMGTRRSSVKIQIKWVQDSGKDYTQSKNQDDVLGMPVTVRIRIDEAAENLHIAKPVGGKSEIIVLFFRGW